MQESCLLQMPTSGQKLGKRARTGLLTYAPSPVPFPKPEHCPVASVGYSLACFPSYGRTAKQGRSQLRGSSGFTPLSRTSLAITVVCRAADAGRRILVTLGRFELPTCGLGNRRSIHLSYRATLARNYSILHRARLPFSPNTFDRGQARF